MPEPVVAARPDRLVVVLGTGTEVGKTWVSAALLRLALDRGLTVSARKPAQSFDPSDPASRPTDAEVLGSASGESPRTVCPERHWYTVAMAPPMAADALGLAPIRLDGLLSAMAPWPSGTDMGLVETAGGLRSPIAHDADCLDLVRAVEPDACVLVADAGLGTINAVRLSVAALDRPVLLMLNRYDDTLDLHRRNRSWLAADGHTLATEIPTLLTHLTT